jgi:septal ring factor EnvC (AmiA/AmiB activator)
MMARALRVLPLLALLGTPLALSAKPHPVPTPRPETGCVPVPHRGAKKAACDSKTPQPAETNAAPEPVTDMSHAVPAKDVLKGPSTSEQFNALRTQIILERPAVTQARQKSDMLKAQAVELQRRLIATAARVVDLETEKVQLDADIVRLTAENAKLSASFARDRVSVIKLLAILERLQHDMPPALVLKPDDALGAARSAMLVGASLPNVYGQAAALARRIATLKKTRELLTQRRADGVRNAAKLAVARDQLDQLLAMKQTEADAAATRYGDLEGRLEKAANAAADLKTLLEKVARLRARPGQMDITVVAAQMAGSGGVLQPRSLLMPVVGRQVPGGIDGVGGARAPGLTFAVEPGARVIAPADSEVLFAGPYHKTGQVLILELTTGYDLVLAGLGRVDVRPRDEVLAGEPVGLMPKIGQDARLYFELRQNGHGVSPAPWLAVELRKAQRS